MGLYRITSSFMNQQALNYLNGNLLQLTRIQERVSSGQNINQPSDDPVGLTRILDLSNTLRTDTRYGKNVQDAVAQINTTDTVLSNMIDLVHRTQELTTQAASFTNNQAGRDSIAMEVDQIINQMIQLGNTDVAGKYIFGGQITDQPPFSRTADDIIYSGTPSNEAWQRDVEISRDITVTININGDDLLGNVQVPIPGPPLPPTFSANSQGLFRTMIELKQDLQAGGAPNQLQEIRNRLDELTADMDNLLARQATVGSVANRLDLTQGRIDERESILTKQYASIQDVNLPETIANLNQQQNVFQASLSVTARLMQNSLLNYLR